MKPSTYTQATADEIVSRLSEGEPLTQICRDEGMPAKRTVSDWRKAHEDFDEAFLQAREEGFDAIAQDCLSIADDSGGDFTETPAGQAYNAEHVQRSKLRVDTRLKLLAKWDPRRYGERMTLAGDAENPLTGLTDEQLDARLKKLMASQDPDGEPA